MKLGTELALLLIHLTAISAWSFRDSPLFDLFADNALTMIAIPVIAVAAGRCWPFWMVLPVIAWPIAGKTLRQLSYQSDVVPHGTGWLVLFFTPMLLTGLAAVYWSLRAERHTARSFCRVTLMLLTWIFFSLNQAFFENPLPWQEWTTRTPNAILFLICALGLTFLAIGASQKTVEGPY